MEERPGLVIESEEGIQQALISVLRTLGHAWVLTNSAEEALAALAENDFLFTWLKTQGIDDALIQPYSGHESRQSLEIYSRLALADAQKEYQGVIERFPV